MPADRDRIDPVASSTEPRRSPCFAHQRLDALREPAPVRLRRVGARRRRAAGTRASCCGNQRCSHARYHSRTPGFRCSARPDDVRGAGLRDRGERRIEVLDRVREVRQHRHQEHPALEPGLPRRRDGREARAAAVGVPGSTSACRSGSKTAMDIARSTGPCSAIRASSGRSRRSSVPFVSSETGVPRVGERLEDPGHQPVAPLRPLVRIGVRAERDRRAAPRRAARARRAAPRATFTFTTTSASKSAGSVELEVPVRGSREAVDAGVRAAAVGVDRPAVRRARDACRAPCSAPTSPGPRRRSSPRTPAAGSSARGRAPSRAPAALPGSRLRPAAPPIACRSVEHMFDRCATRVRATRRRAVGTLRAPDRPASVNSAYAVRPSVFAVDSWMRRALRGSSESRVP